MKRPTKVVMLSALQLVTLRITSTDLKGSMNLYILLGLYSLILKAQWSKITVERQNTTDAPFNCVKFLFLFFLIHKAQSV